MNSIKILVESIETIYPNKSEYRIEPDLGSETFEDKGDTPNEDGHLLDHDNDLNEKDETISKTGDDKSHAFKTMLQIVFFGPNYLIVKPLLFLWLLLTYPFAYFFTKLDSGDSDLIPDEAGLDSHSKSDIIDSDKKTEIIKQENILSNAIKSPSGSSKYIIPPPQRLYPLSRNPGRKRKKKTLVLDLDETLIHSLSRGSPRSFGSSSSCHMIEIKLNNIATLYYVYKRPYCDFFLKEISKWFELQIFTASVKEYADPIIDWLESDIMDRKSSTPNQKVFTKRYYRTDCTYRPGVGYIKNLSKFFAKEDELKNVVILDNSPISYALHEDNAVMIEGWINDQSDRDLLNLLPMLHSLSFCIDVRFILGLRSGEKVFER